MDLLSIIPLVITALFLACVLIGFLVGLVRGLKKTLIRTIWVVVIGVLLIFVTTPIALSLLKANISWIPGISNFLQGSTSIEGFLITTLTQNMEGITADQVQPFISFIASLIAMVASGILFLVFFLLLKYLSLPFYWILNIFIGKTKHGKKRLLGGAVGALLGVLVFTFISTPIVGYVNIANKFDQISAGLIQTPYTASADNDHGDELLSQSPFGEILDSFNNSVVIKVYDTIGLKKLQVVIFNQTSAVKISGETIKLNDEIDSIGNVIIQVLPFTDGTIDINNFEAILNDPEQLEYFSTTVSGLLNSLYDSKLFTSVLNTVMPTVASFLEEVITETITSTPDLDPTLAEPLTNLLSDFFSGIANSDAEKISNAFTSVIDVIAIIPKIQSEEGLASLTTEDFSKFGGVLDSFIDSGLIKQETIGELVPALLDMALNAMGENAEIPEALTTFIGELKESFKSGDISYANEIKVVGELISCFTTLDFSGENLNSETFKNLGASLDRAFSHDSKIFTRELVDSLVIGLIDMMATTDTPELENFKEVFELIKKPFENHEITSYEKEFDAFGEIIDYVTNLNEEEVDLVEVGEKLDTVLTKDSKIINREFVNSLITILIDNFAGDLDEELQPTLEQIKTNITSKEISFKKEFAAIQKLLDTITELDGEEIELSKIGKTLDEVIADSDIIDHEVINLAITVFIDEFAVELDEGLKPTLDKIEENITSTEISFEKEFGAIEKLLDTFENLEGEELNLTEIGKTLDEVIADSDIINHDVINLAITVFIDEFTIDIDENLKPSVEKIKNNITSTEISFEKEFGAIEKLLDTFENLEGEELDLPEIGKTLDEVIEDSDIINHDVINLAITVFIDEFASELDEDLKPTLDKIEENITSTEISFEKEFSAIQKLLDTFENLEGEELDLPEIGKTLDEVIADSDIINHEVINLAITVFIDEFAVELDEDLKPTLDKIEENITSTEISFEKEFSAIQKLLDTFETLEDEDPDIEAIGETLDEVIEDSDVIDHEVINETIAILIDKFTPDLDESLQPTVEDIKAKLTSTTISYKNEFAAIKKLLNTFETIDTENPDLESIGKTLDEVVLESDIIDNDLINNTITNIIDEFTAEIDEAFKPTIDSIKNNLSGNISYETECWAIQQFLDIIEVSNNEDIDLPLIGETLDEVILKSNIVTRELINSTIQILIDEASDNISADNQETINEIREGFNRTDLVYKDEFLALDSLLDILDYANGNEVDLSTVGHKIDETLNIGSKIITHDLINSTIQMLIDEATGEIDNQYPETINDIKNGFNGNELIYETEFLALESLLDVINYANSTNVDLSNVGKQIDETLALESKIITYDLINSCIQILIDEATADVNTEHINTINDIKNGFTGELVYETEFLALESLLNIFDYANGNGADLASVGEKLDQTLSLGSKIITRSIINESIQILIDDATDSVSEKYSETIKDIKDGFKRLDLSYTTEFLALDSLLNIFDFADSDSVNLASVGEQLDQTLLLGSKIITPSLINESIQILIDEATYDVSEEHQDTITSIKNGFTGEDLVYKTEFLALDSLLEVFDFASSNEVNLANVGKQLDQTLALGSKIITRPLINSSVKTLIDEATDGVSIEHQGTITSIKNGFNRLDLTYETEFLALDSLLDVFDFANNEGVILANVGMQLDQTLALGSKIITRSLINSSVQTLIDEATEGVNTEYNGVISDIKNGFSGNNLVYQNEFEALDTLLEAIDNADSVELKFIGQDLDYIVINVQSKVITRNLINSAIKVLIDDATADISDTNVLSTIDKIKDGFDRDDLSYELELTAIDELINTVDSATTTDVNLPNFGKKLDDILALNSNIVTKNLINEFIASSFDSFVTSEDISHAGSLSTSLSNIKVRIVDSNYQIASYETEFTAVDKLIEISSVAGNLSIQDVDKKKFDGNTKTIGEVFDDKIKDSVLLGDCGVDVIESLIDTLNEQNNGLAGNRDYSKITSIIAQNFDAIKPNVKCASNNNLTKSGTVTYTQLAHSFAEIEHYLDDSAHKVTDQTEFTPDIATYYESSLNTMQNNILLDKNGTRAVASYICEEIAVILENKAQAIPFPEVAGVVRSYKDIILTYKAYLERPTTLSNNKLSEKEPYTTKGATQYVTSTDGFKTNVTYTTIKPSSNYAYRTNPFTSIASEISELIP